MMHLRCHLCHHLVQPEHSDEAFWRCQGCGLPFALSQIAMGYAARWHQEKLYGERPYVFHLRQVVGLINQYQMPDAEQMRAAGWLHDAVEDDTGATIDRIRALFGDVVAEIVEVLTDGQGTRKERTEGMLLRMQAAETVHPIRVKYCDRLANARDAKITKPRSYRRYKEEYPEFRLLSSRYWPNDPYLTVIRDELDQLFL